MNKIFLILMISSVAWAQSGIRSLPNSEPETRKEGFDDLLSCGNRISGFSVFSNSTNLNGPIWQGRIGGAGWEDDGKFFRVKVSVRKEGDQCFLEINSPERTMKFEYWVGSDLSKIKALSGRGLSESHRTCSVDILYAPSLSGCSDPVKIIEERRPRSRGDPCEITSYQPFPKAEIDFISQSSERVCVGVTHCVPIRPLDVDDRYIRPPYDSWVACLPASNGECLQSYNNCGDDEHVAPRSDAAAQRLRQTLGLPPRSRGQQ